MATRKKKLQPAKNQSLIGQSVNALEDIIYRDKVMANRSDRGVIVRFTEKAGLPVIQWDSQPTDNDDCITLWEKISMSDDRSPCAPQFVFV